MPSHSNTAAFGTFDDRLVASVVDGGFIVVRAPVSMHLALFAHASRRARARAHCSIEVAKQMLGTPVFREVATQLGLAELPTDPTVCADVVAAEAHTRRAVLVLPLPDRGTWDFAVASELVKRARPFLVVFVTSDETPGWNEDASGACFDLAPAYAQPIGT